MLNLLKPIIILSSALVGAGVAAYNSANENDEKDEIIEDLAERYNELVESINNGTLDLDSLDDTDFEEFEDEDDEDDEEESEENEEYDGISEDNENLKYFPRTFINDTDGVHNRIQNLYTDIENCNDGYITFDEDELLEELNKAAVMLCSAYQSQYINGLAVYINLLKGKIVEIRRIPNYDSSVRRNKESLITDINVLIESATKLNEALNIDRQDKIRMYTEAEYINEQENEDEDSFVVPVYHKKGKED